MARITNSMMSLTYLSNMNRNLNNMQTLQKQLSSGKEINRPSDNPYKASRAMGLYSEIDANKQYNENIKDLSNWLDTTDTALGQAGSLFSRIRELEVSAGNAAYGNDERTAIQDEIKEKVGELSQILNTNFDGAYIFGGTKSTSKPVVVDSNGVLCYADKNGNGITKNGTDMSIDLSTNPIKSSVVPANNKKIDDIVKVGNTVTITINDYTVPATPVPSTVTIDLTSVGTGTPPVTVESLFKATGAGTLTAAGFTQVDANEAFSSYNSLDQIGTDLNVEISQGVLVDYNKTATDILEYKDKTGTTRSVMDVLKSIIDNLEPNSYNTATAASNLSQTDDIISNLLQRRAEVGAVSNRMESAQDKNEDENLNMTDILSKTEDIDFTEKTMEYSIMQTVYMAALQTGAKILPKTILDYL